MNVAAQYRERGIGGQRKRAQNAGWKPTSGIVTVPIQVCSGPTAVQFAFVGLLPETKRWSCDTDVD
jgi:hypothetical protein